jgi:hypothetical protein
MVPDRVVRRGSKYVGLKICVLSHGCSRRASGQDSACTKCRRARLSLRPKSWYINHLSNAMGSRWLDEAAFDG